MMTCTSRLRLSDPCPMFCSALSLVACLTATTLFTSPAHAQVTFQDGTFNAGDWTATVYFTSGNGGTGSAAQVASGGNPSFYRSVTHNMAPNPSYVVLLHERMGATYDPATQGSIGQINFSWDTKTFSDVAGYGGQSAALTIEQGGVVYISVYSSNALNSWVHKEQLAQVADNFTEFEGVDHPDFSAVGGPLQFGLLTSNTNPPGGAGASTTIVGYDNWFVEISVATSVGPGVEPLAPALAAARDIIAYPNPASGPIEILFRVPFDRRTDLTIYDLSGRRVRSLVSSRQPVGVQSVTWDRRDDAGRDVAAGAYFARLASGDGFHATERVTIVR
jgi:FlgD Ig-like domain